MLIIIDSRIPEEAIKSLQKLASVFLMPKNDIVYESIQCHPDIFIMQMGHFVIMAPNAPQELKKTLKANNIPFLRGKTNLGKRYPETALYNALFTKNYIIHKKEITDSCIVHQGQKKIFLNVNQAYTRCNLLELPDGSFITSDKGIEKTLKEAQLEVYYFNSEDVELIGQEHGFLGGALGVYQNTIYIIGALSHYTEGQRFKELIQSKKMDIIELYKGPLIDGGGIFFLS